MRIFYLLICLLKPSKSYSFFIVLLIMNILSVGFAESVLAYSICCPVFFEYSICWWLSIHIYAPMHPSIHTYMHTYIHAYIHAYCIQHNLSIHNLLTLTLPHTTCSTPILHHLFSLSCFPHAIFTFLLLLVGRSWHVGLSGPLIFSWSPVLFWLQRDLKNGW